jgi:4-hydroxy-tetrahydrodipicolinate reductase
LSTTEAPAEAEPKRAHRPVPKVPLGLFGAGGRMGRAVCAALESHPELRLVRSVGRETVDRGAFAGCAVVVDFSVAAATGDLFRALEGTGAALVTGVTARDAEAQAQLAAYAALAPVFEAANFSLGVAVLARLAAQAAAWLGTDFDAEIFELHHRRKADAPSGTALALGRAVAEGRGEAWPAARLPVHDGLTGPRPAGGVGLAAGRGGDVVGEHTVFFLGPAERVELTHRATDRAVFAHGALRAARFVSGQAPGRYGMADLVATAHLGADPSTGPHGA